MPLLIPFEPSLPNYRLATVIENTAYIFDVRWNDREGAWYFDVLEQDETAIVHGLKVVLGAYIGRQVQHALFRNGVMIAVDTERTRREATLDDITTRVQVRYYTVTEINGGDSSVGAVVD